MQPCAIYAVILSYACIFVAASDIRCSITGDPTHINDAAVELLQAGRVLEARRCFLGLMQMSDEPAAAVYANLGVVELRLGHPASALPYFQQAIALAPDAAVLRFNLGNCHKELMQLPLAQQQYERALELDGTHLGTHLNLAITLDAQEQLSAARDMYLRLLGLPGSDAYQNMVQVQLALVAGKLCDWHLVDRLQPAVQWAYQQMHQQVQTGHVGTAQLLLYPFDALRLAMSPQQARVVARASAMVAQQQAANAVQAISHTYTPLVQFPHQPQDVMSYMSSTGHGRQLRIGYVCGNVGDHPLSRDMTHVWLRHNRSRHHVTLFALNPVAESSPWLSAQQMAVDSYVPLYGLDIEHAVQQLRVDVLIDLNGFTTYAQPALFALASHVPVKILFKGFVGTSGGTFMTHVITDRVTSPPDLIREQLTERGLMLAAGQTSFVNSHKYLFASVPLWRPTDDDRRYVNVTKEQFVYCCFNSLYKIDRHMFDVWMRVLLQVPHAVLWLLAMPVATTAYLKEAALERGVDPSRLIFTNLTKGNEHFRMKPLCDVFLDTSAYNAHGTAADALWSGVPVLTLVGRLMSQRLAASMVSAAGLAALVMQSLEQYEHTAVELAMDHERLVMIRTQLARARLTAAVFDTDMMTRQLDVGYALLWEAYQAGVLSHQVVVSRRGQ